MTAVEWYIKQMFELNMEDFKSKKGYLGKRRRIEEQAKKMEIEQRTEDYKLGYRHGVGDTVLANMITDKNK